MKKGLKTLLFGGAIGAVIGVLYAPRSGKKTRAKLAEKTDSLWGEQAQKEGTFLGEVAKTTKTAVSAGQDIFQEAAQGTLGTVAKGAKEKSQKFVKNTSNKVVTLANENVKPVFQDKNDELRAKIDAARKKISSQVASNIDEQVQKEKTVTIQPVEETPKVEEKKSDKKRKIKKKPNNW